MADDPRVQRLLDELPTRTLPVHNWLEAHILRRQADSLIRSMPPESNDSH